MILGILLSTTLLLTGLALRLTWVSFSGKANVRPIRVLGAVALSVFVYLYGAWFYLSVYGRYGFAIVVVITAITAWHRRTMAGTQTAVRSRVPTLIIVSVFGLLDVLYFMGTTGQPECAELTFPMKGKQYFVMQGGKGLPANAAHFSSRRAVYAMDIVKLDAWGRRCKQIFSKHLPDYYIFGDTVYSPCNGTIQRAVSDNPDNIPPTRERGPDNLNGVVIEGDNYSVFLGHLQQGEVFVSAGDRVVTGQSLGLVGNSGLSLEPHLHIQVHARSPDNRMWYEEPQLFIRFDGKSYLLFEQIASHSN